MTKATRLCETDGCDRKHLAKGMCSYHYRIANPPKKDKPVECPTCGAVTMRRDPTRKDVKRATGFCSLACRDAWRSDQPDDPMWTSQPPTPRGVRVSKLPLDHPVMWVNQVRPIEYGSCARCAAPTCYPSCSPRRYCSPECKKKARNKRAEARRQLRRSVGAVGIAPIDGAPSARLHISKAKRLRIYARDDYMCWLCGQRTLREHTAGDMRSPSLDHLTPLSMGGTDDDDNLGVAHLGCNIRRSNSESVISIEAA